MKVGDLVRFKNRIGVSGNVFLIMRTGKHKGKEIVWIYPDPVEGYDHTDDDNYYYDHLLEVVSESR